MMAVTNNQSDLVKETFNLITRHPDGTPMSIDEISKTLGMPFYTRLFEIDPSLEKYFTKVHETSCKFVLVLKTLIESLGQEDKIREIRELGEKHAKYAKSSKLLISSKNYDDVGKALLEVVVNRIKNSGFNGSENQLNDVLTSWTAVYYTIVGIMRPEVEL